MEFKIQSLEMTTAPNFYRENSWEFVAGNTARLWMQLRVLDGLGERRYLPAPGSTIKIEFLRSRSTSATAPVSQTVSKNAVQNPDDKSMFYIDLTSTDSQNILTGSVKVIFTENSNPISFVQNYFVTRKAAIPGS